MSKNLLEAVLDLIKINIYIQSLLPHSIPIQNCLNINITTCTINSDH